MSRASWRLAIGLIGLMASAQAAAQSTYGADAVAYANTFPPDVHGGEGQTLAEWAVESGPIDVGIPALFTQWAEARASANAETGELKSESFGAVSLWESCDPCSASTPWANSRARLWDTVTIPPTVYPNGTVVQVDVVAMLSGDVTLHGSPSGGSGWGFEAAFGPTLGTASDNLFALDVYSGGLLPPHVLPVGPVAWIERVEVTVGETYHIWGALNANLGDSGFYGYGLGHYENWVDFYQSASINLQYAPGYEDVTFVSAAGAQVLPLPEPRSHALLPAAAALIFLAARRERRG